MNPSQLDALFQQQWQGALAAYADGSRFNNLPVGIPLTVFFSEKPPLPLLQHYQSQPNRTACFSQWSKAWLRLFIGHFLWLLHRHSTILQISPQHAYLQCDAAGQPQFITWDSRYLTLQPLPDSKQETLIQAYQNLFALIGTGITALSKWAGCNNRIFWHNAANFIEHTLQLLDIRRPDVAAAYQGLFASKEFGGGKNTFYRAIEYIDSFHPLIKGPIRLRRICCLRHQISGQVYCATCPKLKRLDSAELNTLLEAWQHED